MTLQWSPAWPAYVEHSFVSWKSPLRGDDAANTGAAAAALALGLVGTPPPSAHPAVTSVPAQRHPITTRLIVTKLIAHFPSAVGCYRISSRPILVVWAELCKA